MPSPLTAFITRRELASLGSFNTNIVVPFLLFFADIISSRVPVLKYALLLSTTKQLTFTPCLFNCPSQASLSLVSSVSSACATLSTDGQSQSSPNPPFPC